MKSEHPIKRFKFEVFLVNNGTWLESRLKRKLNEMGNLGWDLFSIEKDKERYGWRVVMKQEIVD